VQLHDNDGEVPKPNENETVLDAIERLRRRVRELKADINRISSSPYPSAHCKRRMREQVEALAMRGTPDVTLIVEHDDKLTWPMQRVQSQVFDAQPGAVAFAEVPDTLGLFAWLHHDALIKRLDAEIDAESDDAAALSDEARQVANSEAMADLLAVERDESWFVWSAMAQNLPCEHRSDINPVAVLSLQLITRPHTVPSLGSSPQHAWEIVRRGRDETPIVQPKERVLTTFPAARVRDGSVKQPSRATSITRTALSEPLLYSQTKTRRGNFATIDPSRSGPDGVLTHDHLGPPPTATGHGGQGIERRVRTGWLRRPPRPPRWPWTGRYSSLPQVVDVAPVNPFRGVPERHDPDQRCRNGTLGGRLKLYVRSTNRYATTAWPAS
jgi:hypothetical protein